MKEMFLEQGFDDYLAKPIEMLKLHEILEKWLPREKQIKAAASGIPESSGLFEGRHAEGIDLAAGMERYQNERTYLEILRVYAASIPELLDTLHGTWAQGLQLPNLRR
jgi:DNA-binding response OmpR family regulator